MSNMKGLVIVDDSLKRTGAMSFTQKIRKEERMSNLIVLLDSSGSMSSTVNTGETAYSAAVQCMLKLEFDTAIIFGEYVTQMSISRLKVHQPGGCTPMFQAVKMAFESGKKELILISDGEPTDDTGLSSVYGYTYTEPETLEKSDIYKFCKDNAIKVNGIFVGNENESSMGCLFLKFLSEKTNGTYSFVKREKIELLEDSFLKLLTDGNGNW